jgi:hypothetical protein
MLKTLYWKCPFCSQEIESLWQTQFDLNKRRHEQKHIKPKIEEGVKEAKQRIRKEKKEVQA